MVVAISTLTSSSSIGVKEVSGSDVFNWFKHPHNVAHFVSLRCTVSDGKIPYLVVILLYLDESDVIFAENWFKISR